MKYPTSHGYGLVLRSWTLVVIWFNQAHARFPTLLVISMDAFRHDYVEDCQTPTILKLRSSGVYAPFMKNVFPTKTFPNHHSIATGVYPEVHGVLDSTVYASKDGCSNHTLIGYSYELYHYNNDILPIWTLNQLAGKGRHSGVMMWPGGEFPYGCKKTLPTFHQALNFNTSFEDRVNTVLSWITNPDTPANLVMLYFEEPDMHGHAFGTDSPEVRQQIKNVDKILEYLSQQLKNHNLDSLVTVFVLSDHGMISLNQKNIIDLNKYIDNSTYVAAGSSPVLQIFPIEGKEEFVLSALQKAHQNNINKLDVYTKNEIPSMWHYSSNNRTPPILIVAKQGYAFQDIYKSIEVLNRKFDIEPNPRNKYGIHGYSNTYSEMYPLFFAWGPLVKSGVKINPFNTTELYYLWAHLLQLELEDDTWSNKSETFLSSTIFSMLRLSPQQHSAMDQPILSAPSWTYWFAGLIAVSLLVIIVGVIIHFCKDFQNKSNPGPIICQSRRNVAENQLLLTVESDEELKL